MERGDEKNCENIKWAWKDAEGNKNAAPHCPRVKHFSSPSSQSKKYYAGIINKAKILCEKSEKCNGFTAFISPRYKKSQICFRKKLGTLDDQACGRTGCSGNHCHRIKGGRESQKDKLLSVPYKGKKCVGNRCEDRHRQFGSILYCKFYESGVAGMSLMIVMFILAVISFIEAVRWLSRKWSSCKT